MANKVKKAHKDKKQIVRKYLYSIFNGICVYCGIQTNLKDRESRQYATLEHAMPLCKGGNKTITRNNENLILACQRCNNSRREKSLITFLKSHKKRWKPLDSINERAKLRVLA